MIDVLVLGSGFGGAVMAARLAPVVKQLGEHRRLVVLERGDDPTGALDPRGRGPALNSHGNRFRHSFAPRYLANLAHLYTDTEARFRDGAPSLTVATGRALGGGSQVYDGVSLRAPTVAFEQQRDGRRLWPREYTRATLDPYYALVEQKLNVRQLAWSTATAPHWALTTKRDWVFAEGCRRIGATAVPLKVATLDDDNEGWWNEGQRLKGRQSLTLNYLADAHAAGAELWTGCDVSSIAPTRDGYVVKGTDHRVGQPLELECKVLVVACGAVGSSALLLQSAAAFEPSGGLDPRGLLGKRVSGNGDYGVTGTVGASFGMDVETFKGKPMASFSPSFFREHGFIVIPFYAAPLYLALNQFSSALPAKDPSALGRGSTEASTTRDWGLSYKRALTQFGSRMLTMGCLAFDDGEGEVHLGPRGPQVTWRETSRATEARWSKAVETMGRIYSALGGELFLDAYRARGTVHTAHPLGGVPMADDDARGVVSPLGEHFSQKNLFVVDSAIIPSSLCANPSLTIAALAERISSKLVSGEGTESLHARLR